MDNFPPQTKRWMCVTDAWWVTYFSNLSVRKTMWSCILRRRISPRTSLAVGWQHRVCCPLHQDWILTAALSASVINVFLKNKPTSPFIFALSVDASGPSSGAPAPKAGGAGVMAPASFSIVFWSGFSVGGWRVLCVLGCAGRFRARESGSNVSVSSSVSVWVVCRSVSDVKGRNTDSDDSMLLLSLSSSVCTSSK